MLRTKNRLFHCKCMCLHVRNLKPCSNILTFGMRFYFLWKSSDTFDFSVVLVAALLAYTGAQRGLMRPPSWIAGTTLLFFRSGILHRSSSTSCSYAWRARTMITLSESVSRFSVIVSTCNETFVLVDVWPRSSLIKATVDLTKFEHIEAVSKKKQFGFGWSSDRETNVFPRRLHGLTRAATNTRKMVPACDRPCVWKSVWRCTYT